MGKMLLPFVVLFLIFGLTGCELKGPESSPKYGAKKTGRYTRYDNKEYGFSIELPDGWKISDNPASEREGVKRSFRTVYQAKSPFEDEKDPFRESIAVVVVDVKQARRRSVLRRYSKLTKKGDVTKVLQAGFVRIHGMLARWSVSKSYPSKTGDFRLRQMAYDIRKGKRVYKIGWVGQAHKLAEYRKIVTHVAYSIKIGVGTN